MIINSKGLYYINDQNIEKRAQSTYTYLSGFNEHEYYYIEFKSSLNKLADCLVENDLLNKLINEDLYLILCNSHEAFHWIVSEVYNKAIIELGIPEHKILLLSESADILTEVKKVAANLGKQEIKVKWTRMFEWSCTQQAIHNHKKNPKLINKHFNKAFLNFNRRWRLHRVALVALLYSTNLLDRGHVSLAPVEGQDWDRVFWQLEIQHNEEIKELFKQNKQGILNLPPMYLDTTNLNENQARCKPSTDYLYADSYFSVVSETNFYKDAPGRFLSEKVFKPVVHEHPFILVSRPHSLEAFRSLGYKTFSPYINESYDLEEDESKRLFMIIAEIKRLSTLNQSELNEFLHGLKEVCDYNLEVLLNKTNFITDLN
jgi:hypothetical protein